jgi:hypothetical protein
LEPEPSPVWFDVGVSFDSDWYVGAERCTDTGATVATGTPELWLESRKRVANVFFCSFLAESTRK